jgi:thiol:disulfide interchange protein DsbD
LDLLPRAGAWMNTIKQLFGVVFMGVAVFMIQPLIQESSRDALVGNTRGCFWLWMFTLLHGKTCAFRGRAASAC